MKPIRKTIRPKNYDSWKSSHKADIATWIANTSLSGTDIWKKISHLAYNDLKLTLLRQQGYVCCYCGSPVDEKQLEIEHLAPKSRYRNQIFDYENLYGSCFGGYGEEFYFVKQDGESVEDVARKYAVKIDTIEKYSSGKDVYLPLQADEILQKGYKLRISPIKNDKHCGNKKGGKEITFNLGDKNLSKFFDYQSDGEVKITSLSPSGTDDSINDILNLNESMLVNRRKTIIQGFSEWFSALSSMGLSKTDFLLMIETRKSDYEKKDKDKFKPYYFVYLNQIEKNFNI